MIFLLKRRITMGKLIKWVMLLISCSVLFGKGELPSDFVMIVSILMFLGSVIWIIYDWYEGKSGAQKQNIRNTGRALDILMKFFGR